ncbi:MAG: discoidin domain-containing protein [Candidatus Izemoplasmatales bacterium]
MPKKIVLFLLLTTLGAALAATFLRLSADAVEPRAYGVDLACGRRVVSTPNTDTNYNVRAVDADPATRYASEARDDAWFYVDLGSLEKVGKVTIDWEAAYASKYEIQMSQDAVTWQTVATVENTQRTVDEITFDAWIECRFVRFQGVSRATGYGYSFYSFEVYGPQDLAVGATANVSSFEAEAVHRASHMTDNVASTRWASAAADGQHAIFDLGSTKTFDLVKIRWEVSFARIFDVYACDGPDVAPGRADACWTKVTGSDVGLGEVDFLPLSNDVSARYLKLELVQRETSQVTKDTGRFPYDSTFSIYSFELFDWSSIPSVPLGNPMEFSKDAPAWTAMSSITLNPSGLILAPIGRIRDADGVVTDLASIADGDIPGFESFGTYNPAVVYDEENGIFHMIYRAELPDNFNHYFGDKYPLGHMSTLAYAYSYDGIDFTRGEDNPIAWPTTNDEAGGGLEDPRMFKIERDPNRGGRTTYYITYTMYDNSVTREGIIYTYDFSTFYKVGRIAPDYGGAIKSGTFVTDPEGNAVMITDPRPGHAGKVYMIYMKDGGYTKIGFTSDVLRIEAADIVDVAVAGFGGNDVEDFTNGNESCMALTNLYGEDDTDIYLMYGGGRLSDGNLQNEQENVSGWFYALGVLKTTKSNPFELTNLRLDLNEPAMHPTDTNKIDYGLFRKCMFADSMIRHDNTWYLYYGAGDMYVAVATARADFAAGAAGFRLDGSVLTASTLALNKAYGADKSDRSVEFVLEVHALDGTLLDAVVSPYAVPHFSRTALGKYSTGIPVDVAVDLSLIESLPAQYYVVAFVRDADTHENLNHPSVYTVVDGTAVSTPK